MSQTLNDRAELRKFNQRMTTAGKFWSCYAIGFILFAYAVVDFVTRWFA